MTTFLFLHRWMCYVVGIVIALVFVVLYGNCSAAVELDFRFFMLDVFFGSILAYSIGILIECASMLVYLRNLKRK